MRFPAILQDRLILEREGDVLLVHLMESRWFDEAAVYELGELLSSFAEESPVRIWINLSHVDYVGSFLLGKFVSLLRNLVRTGGTFYLIGLQPLVEEVLGLLRLMNIFPIRPDLLLPSCPVEPDPLEATFLESIRAEPDEKAHWFALTDWLEERDDPRAIFLRLQERLPASEPRLVPAPVEHPPLRWPETWLQSGDTSGSSS